MRTPSQSEILYFDIVGTNMESREQFWGSGVVKERSTQGRAQQEVVQNQQQATEQSQGQKAARQNRKQRKQSISASGLWVSAFAERQPRGYLVVSVILMSLGYLSLLLFPLLVIEGISVLARELPNVKTVGHWLVVEVWFAIILFCLFISQQIFSLRFCRVPGIKMSKELTPDLYALIADVRKHTERPLVRNIVLTDQYELRIEETPRFGYPFMASNTLVIGMPMLQTLSMEQFHGELLRLFSQYAGGRIRVTHWLYRTRLLWQKYHASLKKSRRIGDMPLRWYFALYAPLYERFTVPAARMDELAADLAVLEWLNDRDYFDTIKSGVIAEKFLDTHFWKNVYQAALKNPDAKLSPFKKLENISGYLKSKDFRQKCLKTAFKETQDFSSTEPSLHARMDNICQAQLREAPLVEKTAAELCLGNARKNYVPLIDKLWRSASFPKWREDYDKRKESLREVKKLSRKSQKHTLNISEIMCYARIAKQLRGDSRMKSVRKLLKRNLRHLWPASLSLKSVQSKLKVRQQANDIF